MLDSQQAHLHADNSPKSPDQGFEYYSEEGVLRPEFVSMVVEAIDEGDANRLVALIDPLHESELGDLIEALAPERHLALVELAGNDFDILSLTEVSEGLRVEIIDHLPNKEVAKALVDQDSDDAVFILEDMEDEDRLEVLARMPFEERARLKMSLEYPEETAGRRMQTEFVAVPPFWTVGHAIDYMRESTNLPDRFHEIFVVSPSFELLGSVELDAILRSDRNTNIEEITSDSLHPIEAEMDQEEAAQIFERYDLVSAAVVDKSNRLVGILTIDDVVDVINQEADEDIKRMGGVGDEEITDSIFETVRSRFIWLLINLLTAILASIVIGLFDATIDQMVALAVLMPIVASMGGNAGTQTMTITVRALATKDLDIYNSGRVIRREMGIGVANGIVFAMIIGPIAMVWFSNPSLGLIIAIAMIFNMLCAAGAGILIPLLLDKLKIDPAISSSVFVTTVTDVFGFFVFLSLAAWWYGIG